MLYEKKISFRLKGNRTYVQGPDIFDKTLDGVRDFFKEYPSQVKGEFHRLLMHNAVLRIYRDTEEIDYEKINAHFSIQIKNSSYPVAIIESQSPITSSYEYDEHKVLDHLVIEHGAARMVAKAAYTYIEQIVAMTKKLHLTLYPDAKKKWLFTKIEIKDVIDPSRYPGHELAIKVVRNFHHRLTQNAILLDDNSIGNIWFS